MRLQESVEVVEHHARLHTNGTRFLVEIEDVVEVPAVVDDQRGTNRLSALRGATATRQDRHALVERDLHGDLRIGFTLRHHHADRFDLINRGVGRIAAA